MTGKTERKRPRRAAALSLCLAAALLLSVFPPAALADDKPFEALSYPAEALTAYDPAMTLRVSSGDDHVSNRGYADETGLYVSPCWRCEIAGESVPVYAAMSYDYETDVGVPHSFACVWVKDFGGGLTVRLTSLGDDVRSAAILPESLGTGCETADGCVSFTVRGAGRYTCLINGDSQKDAVTLTVKDYTDEAAEIAAFQARYGADQVKVYPKGYYEADGIEAADKTVVYFCRGSFFAVPHHYDIRSEADAAGAPAQPEFFSLTGRTGVTVTGFGTVDFTGVDRGERGCVFFSRCADTDVEGLLLLDPQGWAVTAYGCDGLRLRGIEVIGYRTNSDAVNICGCRNVTVSDCFARNGDDCFSVKTTNTVFPAEHIRFENCIAWSNKARCFGVTGEVEMPIRDVTFADSAVICRGATWDNDRVCSLAVMAETGGAPVSDVVFEDIEIRRDAGRPINVMVYNDELEGCEISGVVFRRITANGAERSRLATKRGANVLTRFRCLLSRLLARFFPHSASAEKLCPTKNKIDVMLDRVTINGKKVTAANWRAFFAVTGNETVRAVNP